MTVSALWALVGFTVSFQLDIGQLPATDNSFLRLGGKGIPCLHIMKIFLDQDVAAAGEGSVLFANERSLKRSRVSRILRAIDETDEVAIFEVTEALGFVGNRNCVSDAFHDLCRQLEADIHPPGADMEQHIARSSDSMPIAAPKLPERMKFGRTRIAKEPVPHIGTESRDTGQSGLDVAELDRTNQSGEVATEGAEGCITLWLRLHGDDKEDRARGKRSEQLVAEEEPD